MLKKINEARVTIMVRSPKSMIHRVNLLALGSDFFICNDKTYGQKKSCDDA